MLFKRKSKNLERSRKQIDFNEDIKSIDMLIGSAIRCLKSDVLDEKNKRGLAINLEHYRSFVRKINEIADEKYTTPQIAIQVKSYAQEMLAKFEEAARPYL